MARILLKPYYNLNGEVAYHANKSYGLHSEEFINQASKLADEISSREGGLFKIPRKVYPDGAPLMKYKKLEDIQVEDFLRALKVKYRKNIWGDIVVKGDLNLSQLELTELPDLTNVVVKGNFHCRHNKLTSLKGSPRIVYGCFNCNNNKLTSLDGMSKIIKGQVNCSSNKLTTLEGAPKEARKGFNCRHNQLETLKGAPEIVKGDFDCDNNKLVSLKGAPRVVSAMFLCKDNKLTSLEYIAETIKGFIYCENNPLKSLDYVPVSVQYIRSDLGHYAGNSIPKRLLKIEREEEEGLSQKIFRKISTGF